MTFAKWWFKEGMESIDDWSYLNIAKVAWNARQPEIDRIKDSRAELLATLRIMAQADPLLQPIIAKHAAMDL